MRNDFRLTDTPTLDGTMVKAANTKDPGIVPEPGNVKRDVSLEEMKELSDAVRELITYLIPDPVRASVYMDGYTQDDHSIVGSVSGVENTIVGRGFSGHGFKMAHISGLIEADFIIDGKRY